MRSRASSPGRPLSDTKVSGRRVTCKAPLAHLEGESDRSEVSPTAILQSTHSLEGVSLLKKSVEGLWMDLNRVQRPKKWCHRGQKEAQKRVPESFSTRSPLLGTSVNKKDREYTVGPSKDALEKSPI